MNDNLLLLHIARCELIIRTLEQRVAELEELLKSQVEPPAQKEDDNGSV